MTSARQRAFEPVAFDDTGVRSGGPTALFSCSLSGALLAVGPSLGGLPGGPAHALLHPLSAARLDAALQAARDGAVRGTATLRFRLTGGSGVEVPVSWSVLAGARPDSTQVVFVGADESAGRGFRPSLRVQEAVDRLSREVTVVAAADGALLYASPSVAGVLGYGADTLLPADVWSVLHPDDLESARAGLNAVVDGGDPRAATLRVRAAAGDWRWVELVAVSLRDDALAGVACALHDITAEVEAKQALRAAEARVRALSDVTDVRPAEHDPREDVEQRCALAADLRAALADDALHLEYQPVVDLRSGVVVGLEALARWTDPERGTVSPTTFVAVAERTGLAPQLDRWAVQRALQDMAALRAAGVVPEEAYIAVNLSACSVADTFAVEDLLSWIEQAGLPPSQVVLEITETAIMQNADVAIRLLRRLREHGVRVAMDDFGTGYSSLAYLRDLPISTLKIDRSFVADITEHPDARAIVASVVALARAVGVAVVAEGVETAIQAAILHRLGCVHAQGWLWSRSVPASVLLGGDRWSTPLASTGEANAHARAHGEPDAGVAHGLRRLFELHQAGASVATIVDTLDAEGFRTPVGRRWHRSSVAQVIAQRIRRTCPPETSRQARPTWPATRPERGF